MVNVVNWPNRRNSFAVSTTGVQTLSARVFAERDRHVAQAIWLELERAYGGGGLANSWTWTSTWLDHYGDRVPHRFVACFDRDRPLGMALLTRGSHLKRGPVRLRTVHIGTAGEPCGETIRVQYNRLLVSPNHRDAFARMLLELVPTVFGGSHLLILDGFCPTESAPFLASGEGFRATRQPSFVADLAAIRAGGGSVVDALRKGTRAKIRRSNKALEERYGPIRVEWAESLGQAYQIYDEMVRIHNERWRSEARPGVFESPHFDQFHRQIITQLFPKGGVLLARVTAGDVTIGCDYDFIERGRALAYQWGIAQFDDNAISSGLVVGSAVMQAALEHGLDEYDWLAGDVLYKRMLSTVEHELIWASRPIGPLVPALDVAARVTKTIVSTINPQSSRLAAAA